MFPELKNNTVRAKLLAKIRTFFAERQVLEVETPLLGTSTIPDPHIHSFSTKYAPTNQTLYLQTSPEFAMKRLLAAGSGSIYQICKAFRNEEQGKQHNPEFTILEWYRVDFNHLQLMDEMDELLIYILNTKPAKRLTYQQLFKEHLQIDPLQSSIDELKNCALSYKLNNIGDLDHDGWLNLLLTHLIEPHLGQQQPTFIYNYPASQAALAKINNNIAERFEVYIKGLELANGFHELTDAQQQRQRFQAELKQRQLLNLPQPPIDEDLLAALEQGLPNCAGVALGIDRLLMLLSNTENIANTLAISGYG